MKTTLKNFALILLFVTSLQTAESFAQAPSWQWARGAGSTGSEMATGSAIDASGNLYVTGWYTSANITFGSTTLVNAGNFTSDIFLVKYDPAGTLIWAKTFGNTDGDLGNGIALDASGNIYVTGWYASSSVAFGSFTLTNASAGSSDVFIAKFDPSGNAIWAKTAGGSSADRGYGIATDPSGNVFTTGAFGSSAINFGTGNLTNAGSASSDFFIVKHDGNGNALWSDRAGGSDSDMGYSAATDSLGNVYVTGMFTSSAITFSTGSLTNSSAGTQDMFVAKYNGSGTAAWSLRAGGSGDDSGNGICIKKDQVYVTGGFSSSSVNIGTTTLTNASAGTSDALLAAYDFGLNPVWARRAGDLDSEAGNSVAADAAGNVFVAGYFNSPNVTFGTTTLTNFMVGYRDLFVVAYTASGTALWAVGAGDSFDETSNCISVNSAGTDIYTGGVFNSGVVSFGGNNVYKGCGDDFFVAKLYGTSSVGINEAGLADYQLVYPNPSKGKFSVKGEGIISFYNALGENVLSKKLTGASEFVSNEFDFSAQPKGVYLYRISSEHKKAVNGRIVIQ